MKYMKEAGTRQNFYMFWLCYCEVYVGISFLHYIVTWTGRTFVHDDVAITSLGTAIGLFFLRGIHASFQKIKFSK
jgi:hypothetical protein